MLSFTSHVCVIESSTVFVTHHPRPVAAGAVLDFGAGLVPSAVAALTRGINVDGDFFIHAFSGLSERQLHNILRIKKTLHLNLS